MFIANLLCFIICILAVEDLRETRNEKQIMDKKIIIVGSSNTDMVVSLSHLPKPGETVLGGKFSTVPGGKGANQAVAAARAGGNITFITRVGDDNFGLEAVKGFVKDNINVDYIIKDTETPSGIAVISVDKEGRNSIAVASGANMKLSPDDIENVKDVISSADYLIMQLEIPLKTVEKAAFIAKQNGVSVILNPAPAQVLHEELLKNVDILTPNEVEAESITGIEVDTIENAKKASEALYKKGVKIIIITLGSRGVYVYSDDYKGIVEGFKVEAVDTTAAGDTFNGALSVALSEGKTIVDAAKFANAAAALSVMKPGAQPSTPKREDIDRFLRDKY